MSGPKSVAVDFVKELRLRRWARENFVPPENRRDSWHPVVLQEMAAKDAEMANRRPVGFPYVPLAPLGAHTVHLGHIDGPAPNIAHSPDESEIYFHG